MLSAFYLRLDPNNSDLFGVKQQGPYKSDHYRYERYAVETQKPRRKSGAFTMTCTASQLEQRIARDLFTEFRRWRPIVRLIVQQTVSSMVRRARFRVPAALIDVNGELADRLRDRLHSGANWSARHGDAWRDADV